MDIAVCSLRLLTSILSLHDKGSVIFGVERHAPLGKIPYGMRSKYYNKQIYKKEKGRGGYCRIPQVGVPRQRVVQNLFYKFCPKIHRLAHKTKKTNAKCISLFGGGQGWIRTTEVSDGRFTVCSLWPLGNLPKIYMKIVKNN